MFNFLKKKLTTEQLEQNVRDFIVSNKNTETFNSKDRAIQLEKEIGLYNKIKDLKSYATSAQGPFFLWCNELRTKNITKLHSYIVEESDSNLISVLDDSSIKYVIGFNQGDDGMRLVIEKLLIDTKYLQKNMNSLSDNELSEVVFLVHANANSYQVEVFRPGEWTIDIIKAVSFLDNKYREWANKIINTANNLEKVKFTSTD